MKTPSFLELKSLVEYLSDELDDSQLQEVISTQDGLVLLFYRFTKTPRSLYIVLDLDGRAPFLGFFEDNPWKKLKKTKPVGLFLSAHAKNKKCTGLELVENLGRVVRFKLGEGHDFCEVEFRIIPKSPNLIVTAAGKTISWAPIRELGVHEPGGQALSEEEVRGVPFMMQQWSRMRGLGGGPRVGAVPAESPYEKWKKSQKKAAEKKQKAIAAVLEQIEQYESDVWVKVGEHIKQHGLKKMPPEWLSCIDPKISASQNMQRCFERAKSYKVKARGAKERISVLEDEIRCLTDDSEERFQKHLKELAEKSNKKNANRPVGGRLRKKYIPESDITAYMGKSAADNMDLLRRSKPHDLWIHLKDYPSAHAIIHLNKNQKAPDSAVVSIGQWLLREGVQEKYVKSGGKFSVMVVECRHVKAVKGDKLGRVTYHNGREILIAI